MAATSLPMQDPAQDIAPKLAQLTQDVLFGDMWARTELCARDRSLITIAALIALYRPEQLPFHLERGIHSGLRIEELSEVISHLAFYAGWPAAYSAVRVLRQTIDSSQA